MTVTHLGDRLNGESVTIAASNPRIRAWLQDIATVDRIHHHLGAQLRNGTTDPGARPLRAMRLHSDDAQASILAAVRSAAAEPNSVSLAKEVNDHALRWADALARLTAHAGWFGHLCDALIATHHVVRTGATKPCGRCGIHGERVVLTSPYPGVLDRVTVSCRTCGSSTQHPYGEPGPEIDIRVRSGSGSAVIEIESVAEARALDCSTIHFQFAPGVVDGGPSKPLPIDRVRLEPSGRFATTLDLPDVPSAGAELQALCVSGFQVSTRRFAVSDAAATAPPRVVKPRRGGSSKADPKPAAVAAVVAEQSVDALRGVQA